MSTMSLVPITFRKTAEIYRSAKFISVETLSGVPGLMYREDEPYRVYLDSDAASELIGRTLLAALDKSRFVDNTEPQFFDPDRATRVYENWEKDVMQRYRFKSKRDAYKTMDWCEGQMFDGKIRIEPHRRGSPGSWRSLPPEQRVVIPATGDADAVGAAVRLALERCE
jgi:CDI immunity protein